MEKMVVIIFDNETKAYDGSKAIAELDAEGSISVHAKSVISKNTDGKVEVKDSGNDLPIRTLAGTSIGALIGLLGGPVGVALGAAVGSFTGLISDMNQAGVDAEFLDDVTKDLTPGKYAVVADISEDWETPLDTRMAGLNGSVFRTTRHNVVHQQDVREELAIKAHIAYLKAEQAKAKAEQKAKIQAKIDNLNMNLQSKKEQAEQRSKQQQAETKAKIMALEKKASNAKGEARAKIEAWIAEIKENNKEPNGAAVR
jgi:uncharacterized membrane protein